MEIYFQVLGVASGATDEEIRAAYMKGVKAHPPESSPEMFQRLSLAFERIKDQKARTRLQFEGFCTFSDLDEGVRFLLGERSATPRMPNLKELLAFEGLDKGVTA